MIRDVQQRLGPSAAAWTAQKISIWVVPKLEMMTFGRIDGAR